VSEPSDNDSKPVNVIVPGAAQAPDNGNGDSSRPRSGLLRLAVIALLFLMLSTLVAVVVVLPDLVAERVVVERTPAPPAPIVISPALPPSADAQRLAKEKRQAEKRLGIVLGKQTELEAEAVAIWGGQDYDVALNALAAGDAELQVGRYAKAADIYEKVSGQLDALRASMAERLVSALQAGDAALAADDGPAARGSFDLALAIEPYNERGQRGRLRALVLEDVLALVAAGAEDEARAELDAAKAKYAAALALDASSGAASLAHAAVTGKIREREFNAAMSTALAALESGDFAASRAALIRANGIRPGAPALADVGMRLQLAVQSSRIGAHRRQAQALAREERWREAGTHYAAVLAIDGKAAFARTGRERSLARARIHAELDAYLIEPGRLGAQGPRDKATLLLATVADLNTTSEPKLAAKAARLAEALEIAQTPMPVRLQSDNFTEVTVYKVARFGRLASRELFLPPGTYVAVGKRPGYRDVRVEFTLTAGQKPVDVTVRCQEKI
jgi:hypothetical protein